MTLDRALYDMLTDLDAIERFEATAIGARVGSSLGSWVSEGATGRKASDAEIDAHIALLHADSREGEYARKSYVELLVRQGVESGGSAGSATERPDPDWRRAIALQRRRRATSGRASAVLAWLQGHAPPGADLGDVCRALADAFAPAALRAAWRAEAMPRAKGAGKLQPKAAFARHAFGHDLLAEAIGVWRGENRPNAT